jgi:hypothetical protein
LALDQHALSHSNNAPPSVTVINTPLSVNVPTVSGVPAPNVSNTPSKPGFKFTQGQTEIDTPINFPGSKNGFYNVFNKKDVGEPAHRVNFRGHEGQYRVEDDRIMIHKNGETTGSVLLVDSNVVKRRAQRKGKRPGFKRKKSISYAYQMNVGCTAKVNSVIKRKMPNKRKRHHNEIHMGHLAAYMTTGVNFTADCSPQGADANCKYFTLIEQLPYEALKETVKDPISKKITKKYKEVYITVDTIYEDMLHKDYIEYDNSITFNWPAQLETYTKEYGMIVTRIPLGHAVLVSMCTEKLGDPNCKIDVRSYKINSFYKDKQDLVGSGKNVFERSISKLSPEQVFPDFISLQLTKEPYLNMLHKPLINTINGEDPVTASSNYRKLLELNRIDSKNNPLFKKFFKPKLVD